MRTNTGLGQRQQARWQSVSPTTGRVLEAPQANEAPGSATLPKLHYLPIFANLSGSEAATRIALPERDLSPSQGEEGHDT
jgi:hypothetical protein